MVTDHDSGRKPNAQRLWRTVHLKAVNQRHWEYTGPRLLVCLSHKQMESLDSTYTHVSTSVTVCFTHGGCCQCKCNPTRCSAAAHFPPCQPQTHPDAFPQMLFQRAWCTISQQRIIVFVRIIVQFVQSPENDFLPAPDSGDISDVLSMKASVWAVQISWGRLIIQGQKANGELLLLPG